MIFHASEMPRLVPCPGSKLIQMTYPAPEKTDADEGNVAHFIAKSCLTSTIPISGFLGQSIKNVFVDQEMLSYIEIYLAECGETGGIVETPLCMQHEAHENNGTPDWWKYNPETRVLKIKDLKFGHSVVEVEQNYQLLDYAVIIFHMYPWIRENCRDIEFTIVQPRANHPEGPVRRWSIMAEMMGAYRNTVLGAIDRAALTVPPLQTGPHCRNCSGLLRCHGAKYAAGYALDYAGKCGHSEITPERVALELEITERAVKMLGQRQTALEEEAFSMSKRGLVVPGWEVAPTVTALNWAVDAIAIGDAMQVDLRAPIKPITPTQAISRKLLPKETVEALAAKGTGGLKLQRVNDTKAKRILENG